MPPMKKVAKQGAKEMITDEVKKEIPPCIGKAVGYLYAPLFYTRVLPSPLLDFPLSTYHF